MRLLPAQTTASVAVIGAAVVLGAFVALPVSASPDGAEWETADNPEGCQSCHLGARLVTESKALGIEGLPMQPEAGLRYELNIVLEDPDLQNAGFLLSIASDATARGEFMAIDDRTETSGAMARSTYDGSTPAEPGKVSWRLVWTAPAILEGPLRFVLWGNAGNYDLSPLGDSLHRRIWQLPAGP